MNFFFLHIFSEVPWASITTTIVQQFSRQGRPTVVKVKVGSGPEHKTKITVIKVGQTELKNS